MPVTVIIVLPKILRRYTDNICVQGFEYCTLVHRLITKSRFIRMSLNGSLFITGCDYQKTCMGNYSMEPDRSSHFSTGMLNNIYKILGRQWHLSISYHPQSSGFVKRMSRTIKNKNALTCSELDLK